MNMYIFLIYLLIYVIFFPKIKNKKIGLLLILIPMFLTLAIQIGIGTDYYSYVSFFKNVSFENNTNIEYSFTLFTIFLKKIVNNERILFIVISFIQTFLIYKILKILLKEEIIKSYKLFFIVLVIIFNFYYSMFNTLRSSVAILFFSLSILYFYRKSYLKGSGNIAFGLIFHKSIFFIVFLVIILKKIINLKKCYSKKLIIIFLTICYIGGRLNLISKIALFLYNSIKFNFPYKYYLVSRHMHSYTKSYGLAVLLTFTLILISIKFYNIGKKEHYFLKNIAILFFGLLFLFANTPILLRIAEYGIIFEIIYFTQFMEKMLTKKYRIFGVIIIIIYSIIFIIGRERSKIFNEKVHQKYLEEDILNSK